MGRKSKLKQGMSMDEFAETLFPKLLNLKGTVVKHPPVQLDAGQKLYHMDELIINGGLKEMRAIIFILRYNRYGQPTEEIKPYMFISGDWNNEEVQVVDNDNFNYKGIRCFIDRDNKMLTCLSHRVA